MIFSEIDFKTGFAQPAESVFIYPSGFGPTTRQKRRVCNGPTLITKKIGYWIINLTFFLRGYCLY
jgi:hypothetical protein